MRKASNQKRVAAAFISMMVAAVGSTVPAMAQLQQSAQLAEQVVEGAYRVCTYRTRETSRAFRLNTPIGIPALRSVRVGRGEPCPATFPSWRLDPKRGSGSRD